MYFSLVLSDLQNCGQRWVHFLNLFIGMESKFMPQPLSDRNQQTRFWLQKCAIDLLSAKRLVGDPPLLEPIFFFSQQVVEKSLKAFLTWHGKSTDKTHDIGRIALDVLQIDAGLESLLKRATRLSPFAVVFRYPTDDVRSPTLEEASQALVLAEEVYGEILKRLPEESHP
jgi:HEPN domain-containing protein